jgi:hypothetical protein
MAGTFDIDEADARVLARGPRHRSASLSPRVRQAIAELGWATSTRAIDSVVNQAIGCFYALQNRYELTRFLELVASRKPRTIVEIDTGRGGTLFAVSQFAAHDVLLISVAVPGAPESSALRDADRAVFASFARDAQSRRRIAQWEGRGWVFAASAAAAPHWPTRTATQASARGPEIAGRARTRSAPLLCKQGKRAIAVRQQRGLERVDQRCHVTERAFAKPRFATRQLNCAHFYLFGQIPRPRHEH